MTRLGHAAVALHYVERHAHSILPQLLDHLREISFDQRRERRVDDRRRKAFVLPVLRIDLRRNGNPSVRKSRPHGLRDPLLVCIVGIRMKETDCHRFRAAIVERIAGPGERGFVERYDRIAVTVEPFDDRQPVLPGHQRPRALDEKVVDFAAILTADLDHVAKAFGRDQYDARDFETDLPEKRVGGDRRRMGEKFDCRGVGVAVQQRPQSVHRSALRFERRRRNLDRDGSSAPRLDRDEIGERPADIDADAQPYDGVESLEG